MAAVGARKPFEESLEDLERLANISSRLLSKRKENAQVKNISTLIERGITAMERASHDYLQSYRNLEFSDRVSLVISKLKECDCEADFDALEQLLKDLLYHTRLASDRITDRTVKPMDINSNDEVHNRNHSMAVTSDTKITEDGSWEMTLMVTYNVCSSCILGPEVRFPILKFDVASKLLILGSKNCVMDRYIGVPVFALATFDEHYGLVCFIDRISDFDKEGKTHLIHQSNVPTAWNFLGRLMKMGVKVIQEFDATASAEIFKPTLNSIFRKLGMMLDLLSGRFEPGDVNWQMTEPL